MALWNDTTLSLFGLGITVGAVSVPSLLTRKDRARGEAPGQAGPSERSGPKPSPGSVGARDSEHSSRILEWTVIASLLLVAAGFPLAQAVVETVREGRPHLLSLFQNAPTKENLHGWDRQAADRSIFGKAIRPAMLQLQYDLFGDLGSKAVAGRDGWLFYRPDVEYLQRPAFDDGRFYLGSFDTTVAGRRVNLRDPVVAIRDFRDQLAARGIELLVVPVPGKPSVYPEKLGLSVPLDSSPTLRLIAALRREGIATVDLLHPLTRAKAVSPADLFLHRDTHWSPAGVEVSAGAIADAIRALSSWKGIGAASDSSRYSEKAIAVDRWGDICEMSALPNRRSIWPVERVEARQVLVGETPYADVDTASILWLGDSYSRIYQTDAPKAAGIIARVAYHLGQPLSSVVNDGGASTVVRRQLIRRAHLLARKKIVVWEFVERDIRFGEAGWALETVPVAAGN